MLRTFVHQPQRLWVRRMLFQIHLWAGILLSVYMAVIGLTGSILVFEDELTSLTLPTGSGKASAKAADSVQDIVHAAEQSSPGERCFFLSFPEEHAPFYRAWMRDAAGGQHVLLIDSAGIIIQRGSRSWIEWVHDLHVYLLLGPRGLTVNGIGASALLLLSATGIALWWPGLARWWRGLVVRTSANWRRVNFDLHSAVGFWTLLIALWWAVSGIYFAWPTQFARALGSVVRIEGMRAPVVAEEAVRKDRALSLQAMVDLARRSTRGGTVSGIALPIAATGNVIVYVDRGRPGDFSHRDIHYFGASSGKLLATWHYGENRTAGDWILWAMHPLHFGTVWGMAAKVMWSLLGLSLPVLSVTGLLMYWNRRLRSLVRGA
jgi:uncharacterized iron-regulated membrane protein